MEFESLTNIESSFKRIRLMLANARLSEEELEDDAECAYAGAKKEKYA